jgi:signal peptide peptidase SppA
MKSRMLDAIRSELWEMRPEALASWIASLDAVEPKESSPRLPKTDGGIGLITIQGVIGHRPGGGYHANTYSAEVADWLRKMAANPSIGAIVLDIDSPGGTVAGLAEAADTINDVKALKPVYAVANPEAASAAYHLGSQATRFFATPSGEVGSIGVWAAHVDLSEALTAAGIKVSLISAGKYKVEGNPFEPLGEVAREEIQRSVDMHYEAFLKSVARGRSTTPATVRDTFGQGRMVEAPRAKDLGMIDAIHTLGEVLGGIVKSNRPSNLRQASARIGLTEAGIRR